MGSDICFTGARNLASMIHARKISAREVMQAFLAQIERLNPKINAIVAKLPDEECLALADEADRRIARGDAVGPLHGLPFAFKELDPVVGFPMTRGSVIFKDFIPTEDSVLAERLRFAGVLPIGKTNVSEFGMGSHSYNQIYGTTLNPYDLTKSAGGSSGGAGAALAAGLLPLASGSDLGGSLRNPANFNNIVALRPSVGLVPSAPVALPFLGFTVKGPMARSVADTAFLLKRDGRCRTHAILLAIHPTRLCLPNRWNASSKTFALPGVLILAACRSTGGCAPCWLLSARHSSI